MTSVDYRQFKNKAFKVLITVLAFLCTLPLVFIIGYIVKKGFAAINWSFFTDLPAAVGEPGGGIAHALIGSLFIVLLSTALAVPFGIFGGVYLAESPPSKLTHIIRTGVEVLQGIPSIVIGIIAYLWLVKPMQTFSAFSGSVALAIMMLPLIVRSTEESLKLIPPTYKEAALSLGVPYYKTLLKVILPAAFSGILTGLMMSIARVAGETAPLLFTAFGNAFLNLDMFKPMQSLPLVIFNYAASPYEAWHAIAWGASLVLMAWILLLNLIARLATRKWKIQF